MGRNLSDRQARSDPAAKSQKDKKSEQFPHNRLRSNGGQPCQGCRIASALFQADFSDCFICFRRLRQRQSHQDAEKLRSIPCETSCRRDGSLTISDVRLRSRSRVRRTAGAGAIAWRSSWPSTATPSSPTCWRRWPTARRRARSAPTTGAKRAIRATMGGDDRPRGQQLLDPQAGGGRTRVTERGPDARASPDFPFLPW